VLSGHRFDAPDQVVLGAVTLAELHKHVGEVVVVNNGVDAARNLRIVGTATMPTVGNGGLQHLEMGTGALLSSDVIPSAQRNLFDNPLAGPNTIFIDVRPGADRRAASRSLQDIAHRLSNTSNFGVGAVPVAHPAEIVNYRSLGTTPAVLGAALAAGAVVGLALTLIASVRRRRRDIALLKTLGFTERQLAATVLWQSSVAVVVGTVVGIPVGIVLGRVSWDLFAHEIHAVPAPTVPALATVLIGVGALVIANVVAAVPGRIAARTPTGVLLRAE
jgi:ABC-type antimicrobial peptide transport system permease subunit